VSPFASACTMVFPLLSTQVTLLATTFAMTDEQLAAIAFGSSGPPLEEAEDEGAVH